MYEHKCMYTYIHCKCIVLPQVGHSVLMGVLSVFTQPIESKEKPRANAPYSELSVASHEQQVNFFALTERDTALIASP